MSDLSSAKCTKVDVDIRSLIVPCEKDENRQLRELGIRRKRAGRVAGAQLITHEGISMENYFGKHPRLCLVASEMCGDQASHLSSRQ